MTTPRFHPFRSEAARDEFHAFYADKAGAWPLPVETRLVDPASGQTFVRVAGRDLTMVQAELVVQRMLAFVNEPASAAVAGRAAN